jgi:hypothetical protein
LRRRKEERTWSWWFVLERGLGLSFELPIESLSFFPRVKSILNLEFIDSDEIKP